MPTVLILAANVFVRDWLHVFACICVFMSRRLLSPILPICADVIVTPPASDILHDTRYFSLKRKI